MSLIRTLKANAEQTALINEFRAYASRKGYAENCIEIAIDNAVKSGLVTRNSLVQYLNDANIKGCADDVTTEQRSYFGGRQGTLGR